MVRRNNKTIKLPARKDIRYPVNLDAEERALYNKIRDRIIEDVKKDHNHAQKGLKNDVFQRILSLRRVCSLGLHYESGHAMAQQNSEDESGEDLVQRVSKTELDSTLSGVLTQTNRGVPSKVAALIADISGLGAGEKWSVYS